MYLACLLPSRGVSLCSSSPSTRIERGADDISCQDLQVQHMNMRFNRLYCCLVIYYLAMFLIFLFKRNL